ncbi:MAG: hypothetical protein AAF532_03605 [Planctomycetota bacterium]
MIPETFAVVRRHWPAIRRVLVPLLRFCGLPFPAAAATPSGPVADAADGELLDELGRRYDGFVFAGTPADAERQTDEGADAPAMFRRVHGPRVLGLALAEELADRLRTEALGGRVLEDVVADRDPGDGDDG